MGDWHRVLSGAAKVINQGASLQSKAATIRSTETLLHMSDMLRNAEQFSKSIINSHQVSHYDDSTPPTQIQTLPPPQPQPQPTPTIPNKPPLSVNSVPSSQISRVFNFASLAVGLAGGTLKEKYTRSTSSSPLPTYSASINDENGDRLASALCRMRGAALKVSERSERAFWETSILMATSTTKLS